MYQNNPLIFLPSFKDKIVKVQEKILTHYEENEGFLAWSGGNDSTALLFIAQEVIPNVPVVWYDSGLEYPETREYISLLVESLNLNFTPIVTVPDALTILKNTGSWSHADSYNSETVENMHKTLITVPAAEAHKLYGNGELTGLRAEESTGRRVLLSRDDGHYIRKDGSHVYAPLWSWSDTHVKAVIEYYGYHSNPVYEKLAFLGAPEKAQRVGLVVDGNNPNHGRYTYLRNGWPDLWSQLVKALPRLGEWR